VRAQQPALIEVDAVSDVQPFKVVLNAREMPGREFQFC
jgi:hypothetical protein